VKRIFPPSSFGPNALVLSPITAQPEITSGLEVAAGAATGAEVDGTGVGADPFVCACRTLARHRTKQRGDNFCITLIIMDLFFHTSLNHDNGHESNKKDQIQLVLMM
jgi:hypothetical protein